MNPTLVATAIIRNAINAQRDMQSNPSMAAVPSALVIGILTAQHAPPVAAEILRIMDDANDHAGGLASYRAIRDEFLANLRDAE